MIRIDFDPEKLFKSASVYFLPPELRDAHSLAIKLRDQGDLLSQYLHGQLPTDTQNRLNQYDGSGVDADLLTILVDGLNLMLKSSNLFEKRRFAGLISKQRDVLIKGLNKLDLTGDNLAGFNRLLLEEGYRDELAKSQQAEWVGWTLLADAATDSVIDIQWESWKDQREQWKKNQTPDETPKPFPGFKPKLDDDVWKGFRDWLLENVFHNKCAYCETSFAGFIGDAEHFRPKGEVSVPLEDGGSQVVTVVDEDNNEIAHPGYFWLAYRWQNLLPSCHLCNRYGGKKTLFPVEGSHIAVMPLTIDEIDQLIYKMRKSKRADDIFFLEPRDLDARERPLLLHPYYDNPEEELYFEVGGKAAAWADCKKGAMSIRVYDLNEASKIRARDRGQREGLQHYFSKLSGATVDKREWVKVVNEIREEYYRGERPYAVAVFDYLHDRFEGTEMDPDVLVKDRRKTK
jgi:hypothetical protein